MSRQSLRIGLFGAGVVGGGVYELVQKFARNGRFGQLGASVEIVKICVKSLDKPRDFTVDASQTQFVTNYSDILNDPSINCIIELMGGVTNAKDVVLGALQAGKHVITANKALIANFLPEIQAELAKQPNVQFAYEAAVCGGIPIIHTLQSDFVADQITKVMGIMNGTTNFMLCKMEDEGADYGDVLKEAQRLGFAEADPTADVEGHDVQAKIALLAKLAFGKSIEVPSIPTTGISKITSADFEYAKLLKSTIKLLGTSVLNADGSIAVFVSPTLVPLSSPFASAKGPGNMVVVNSENMGASTFGGPGAGRFPTANSVVNDIVRLSQGLATKPFPLDNANIVVNNDYTAKFYIRISCADGLGIVKAVGEAAEANGVSINSILQNQIVDPSNINFVVTTDVTSFSKVQKVVETLGKQSFVKSSPVFMPLI